MEKSGRISATLALTFLLAVTALADGPAPPPCDPGETHGPPCSANQLVNDDASVPGQIQTSPPPLITVDMASDLEKALIDFLLF